MLDMVEGGESPDAIARETDLTPAASAPSLGRLELLGLVRGTASPATFESRALRALRRAAAH
ncbi:MAG TPA: hypothetical protein VE528_00840 [Thermoleophilaceae bacterium]|nr:hypothetical protein [Thermoleophilaceae bacterium]